MGIFDDITNVIGEVVHAPITILGKVGGVLSSQGAGSSFQWGQTFIQNLATYGSLGIYPLYNKVSSGISGTVNEVKNVVAQGTKDLSGLVNSGKNLLGTISADASSLVSGAKDLEGKLASGLSDVSNAVSGGIGKIGGLAGSLSETISGLGGTFKDLGSGLSDILKNFSGALSSLDLSKFGSVSLPSISIGGSDSGSSILPIAIIGAIGIGAILLLTKVF